MSVSFRHHVTWWVIYIFLLSILPLLHLELLHGIPDLGIKDTVLPWPGPTSLVLLSELRVSRSSSC